MLTFFKDKFGIQISESIFRSLRLALQEVLSNYYYESAVVSERFTLKALLHIYIAHIGCMRPLKISIRDIMSDEEMVEQQKLLDDLNKIDVFPGQSKTPSEKVELPEDQCF